MAKLTSSTLRVNRMRLPSGDRPGRLSYSVVRTRVERSLEPENARAGSVLAPHTEDYFLAARRVARKAWSPMPSRRTRITIALLWRRSWNQEPTPNTIHWPSSDHAGANAPVANLGSRPVFADSKMRFRFGSARFQDGDRGVLVLLGRALGEP